MFIDERVIILLSLVLFFRISERRRLSIRRNRYALLSSRRNLFCNIILIANSFFGRLSAILFATIGNISIFLTLFSTIRNISIFVTLLATVRNINLFDTACVIRFLNSYLLMTEYHLVTTHILLKFTLTNRLLLQRKRLLTHLVLPYTLYIQQKISLQSLNT